MPERSPPPRLARMTPLLPRLPPPPRGVRLRAPPPILLAVSTGSKLTTPSRFRLLPKVKLRLLLPRRVLLSLRRRPHKRNRLLPLRSRHKALRSPPLSNQLKGNRQLRQRLRTSRRCSASIVGP